MIKYKCASCGTKLETEGSLSGKQEACPACGKVNPVPLSKCDLDEQQRQEAERRQMIKEREAKYKERDAEKLRLQEGITQAEMAQMEEQLQKEANIRSVKYKMEARRAESSGEPWAGYAYVLGALLIVAGIITTVYCMGMDVSSGSSHEDAAIANLDKMNQRLGGVVIGVGLFIAGVVVVGMCAINVTLAFTAQVILRASEEARQDRPRPPTPPSMEP